MIHVAATYGMVVGSELHERAVLPKDHYIIQAFINSAVCKRRLAPPQAPTPVLRVAWG